jgi:hypothetical protein
MDQLLGGLPLQPPHQGTRPPPAAQRPRRESSFAAYIVRKYSGTARSFTSRPTSFVERGRCRTRGSKRLKSMVFLLSIGFTFQPPDMQKPFSFSEPSLAGLGVHPRRFSARTDSKRSWRRMSWALYQTGVQYQMYHAFALLLVGILYEPARRSAVNTAGMAFHGRDRAFFGIALPAGIRSRRWARSGSAGSVS